MLRSRFSVHLSQSGFIHRQLLLQVSEDVLAHRLLGIKLLQGICEDHDSLAQLLDFDIQLVHVILIVFVDLWISIALGSAACLLFMGRASLIERDREGIKRLLSTTAGDVDHLASTSSCTNDDVLLLAFDSGGEEGARFNFVAAVLLELVTELVELGSTLRDVARRPIDLALREYLRIYELTQIIVVYFHGQLLVLRNVVLEWLVLGLQDVGLIRELRGLGRRDVLGLLVERYANRFQLVGAVLILQIGQQRTHPVLRCHPFGIIVWRVLALGGWDVLARCMDRLVCLLNPDRWHGHVSPLPLAPVLRCCASCPSVFLRLLLRILHLQVEVLKVAGSGYSLAARIRAIVLVFLALLVSDEAVLVAVKLLTYLLEVRERIDVIFDMDDLLPLRL